MGCYQSGPERKFVCLRFFPITAATDGEGEHTGIERVEKGERY